MYFKSALNLSFLYLLHKLSPNDYLLCCVFLNRNVAFFAGSILAVLIILTVIDEDVLTVEHVFTAMTILGE